MYQERKAMTRVKFLAAALSVLLAMNPGTAAYADSTPDSAEFNIGQNNENIVPESTKTTEEEDTTAEATVNATAGSSESTTVESHETTEPETAETGELNEPHENENNFPATYNDSQTESVGNVFTISGGSIDDGDYSYDANSYTLTILKSTPITIQSVNNQFVNAKIFIKSGVDANITLDSLRIRTTDGAAISMGDSSANVTITLKDGTSNYLNSVNAAGIEKLSKNGKLTITCKHADEENHQCDMNCGMLDARCSKGHGAGIGASGINGAQTGGIYIKGGMILATGTDGAGIGGSNLADVSDINISGGIIEAHGDNGAAGIGSSTNGGVDSINISGGTISAYGSEFRNSSGVCYYGAAIGAAYCSRFDSINISGGTIYANTAYGGTGTGTVAVGAGNNCNSDRTGIIRISDGVVYAVGSGSADAIGVTDSGAKPADIVIDGGSVYPQCGDNCTEHSDKRGMSSVPKDSSGRELILLEIDNSGNESITVNGKTYPSNSTYKTDLINSSTKVDKSYVFMPKNSRNIVTVGTTTTEYIYTESGFTNAENLKLDFYATDSSESLVYGTDYKIDGTTLTILSAKGITIKNVDPTQPCSNDIFVENDVSANITLAGINIQRGLNEYSAIEIASNSSGNVNIILADGTENIISTTYNYAPLSKNSDSAACGILTITCQGSMRSSSHICDSSCGGLNATSSTSPAAIGGDYNKPVYNILINGGRIDANSNDGAGIGGGEGANAKNITINGGIINANSCFGAAIGSGQAGNADGIYINGGVINAAIKYFDMNSDFGCAIGSGANGQADNIVINNGIVTAQGGYNSPALGGWTVGASTPNYRINGGLVYLADDENKHLIPFRSNVTPKNSKGKYVYLAAISNPNGEDICIGSSSLYYKFLNNADKTYYGYFAPDSNGLLNVTVGSEKRTYLLVDDKFEQIGSDFVITGSNASLIYGTDFTYPADTGVLTISTDKPVVIRNADGVSETSDTISIASSNADITLAGVNIKTPSSNSASSTICITGDNNATITLADGTSNTISNNSLKGSCIAKDGSGTLTLTCEKAKTSTAHCCDESCGSLTATTSVSQGTAIGCTSSNSVTKACHIIIKGGNIKASSDFSTAIGGAANCGAEDIVISGGNVSAYSGPRSPAIGGESGADGITIRNARVTAETVGFGAAIGGGQNSNGDNISITNSVVCATGGSGTAIIGGGRTGTGSNISIEDSVVDLQQKGNPGYDVIGNGASDKGDAINIHITNSSVAIKAADGSNALQHSQIKNNLSNDVYLLKIDNPDNAEISVDGVKAIANNNTAAKSGDTSLYLWLGNGDHHVSFDSVSDAFEHDYHFNPERLMDITADAFRLCEPDVSRGYSYNETAHWYVCAGSESCNVMFSYEKHSSGKATCTEKAVCAVCGHEYGNVAGHEISKHAAKAPTCIDTGNIEYYSCSNCGKLFTDENGKNETTLAAVTIAATGKHSFGNWVITKKADCTNDGSRERSCTVCQKTETETISKLGHSYSTAWTTDKAAGCTTTGTKSHHCERCDAKTDITEIPAVGHKFGEWKIIRNATSTREGLKQRICAVCKASEEQSIPKTSGGSSGGSGYSGRPVFRDDRPSINGENQSWDSICNYISTTDNTTFTVLTNGSAIPENVIRVLAEQKKTCEFVIRDAVSIIVDGSRVNGSGAIDYTSAFGNTTGLRGKLSANIVISADGLTFDVKITPGSIDGEKFVNLYRSNNGVKTFVGAARIGADGSAAISVTGSGELIAMICAYSDIPGDADNNGTMNAMDASHLLRFAVGIDSLSNAEMSDVNGDGTVNALDAAAILRKAAGL